MKPRPPPMPKKSSNSANILFSFLRLCFAPAAGARTEKLLRQHDALPPPGVRPARQFQGHAAFFTLQDTRHARPFPVVGIIHVVDFHFLSALTLTRSTSAHCAPSRITKRAP